MLHGVALAQVKRGRETRCQFGGEMRVERAVFFHRPHLRAGFEQRRGERAESRTDFDHAVARAYRGELERFADDVAIDQEILAEETLRLMTESR